MQDQQSQKNSLLCVGLDPDPSRLPEQFQQNTHPFFSFNKTIIDATHDIACCYKPQIAHYAAEGRENELRMTMDYIRRVGVPVLLDAKRGDIGSTAAMYARELFEQYGADAVTLNPYLGMDSLEPFLDYADKGLFIVCRTSNPGSSELQNLVLDNGHQLYEQVAQLATTRWNYNNNIGLVVGATMPEELRRVRQLTGSTTLLLPGVGSQGADVAAMMEAGAGGEILVSASRSIIFAAGSDCADAARQAALNTRDGINQCRIPTMMEASAP